MICSAIEMRGLKATRYTAKNQIADNQYWKRSGPDIHGPTEEYRGGIAFEFAPRHSLNLRSFYGSNCPICRILTDIKRVISDYPHIARHLGSSFGDVCQMLAPTYLSAVATEAPMQEMGLLSPDDTAAVVHASDAVFSDLASGADIKASINDDGKSPVARLEIVLNVAMDPILYRAVHDDKYFGDTISSLLWAEGVPCAYRSYFLLHVPYFANAGFAETILLSEIPKSIRSTKDSPSPVCMVTDAGWSRVTLTRYFNNHPSVFTSIVLAVWVLRRRPELVGSDFNDEWCATLQRTPYDHLFASVTCTTEQDVAKGHATMLLCNFVTSFSEHTESYRKRLTALANDVKSGFRTNSFPCHLMVYIANAIKEVRRHYLLEDALLSDAELDATTGAHKEWLEGDAEAGQRLLLLLNEHFISQQAIHESSIARQLREGLAPNTCRIVKLALAQLSAWISDQHSDKGEEDGLAACLGQVRVRNDAEDTHVFGSTEFLVRTLSHLLRNAFENDTRNATLLAIASEIELVVHRMGDSVRFEVTSAQELSHSLIEHCFRAGGGLMAQKQVVRSWGGNMGGNACGSGRTTFFVEVGVTDVNKKER